MNSKSIVIAIPVYNTDLYKLERCLRSIPDYKNLYVYIYDDCSDKYDAEREISKIINSDSSLSHLYKDGNKFIKLNKNSGLGFVRNLSINDVYNNFGSLGYILFLDSDDEVCINEDVIKKVNNKDNVIYPYRIDLICNNSHDIESSGKFLDQKMIPYLVTPIIYEAKYLLMNKILFDESRRTFEDIQFSVKLWSDIIINNEEEINNILNDKDESIIYRYYLEGESLTRNNKIESMMSDLCHWVNWIRDFYHNLGTGREKVKPYLFNRIRFEMTKVLCMSMEENNDMDKYRNLVRYLKPYNIDKFLD